MRISLQLYREVAFVITFMLPAARCLPVSACPGYTATNIVDFGSTLTADLTLSGVACNTYGDDLNALNLLVEYQTDNRLHVLISDKEEQVYQVPHNIVGRPYGAPTSSRDASAIHFIFVTDPFSFAVTRNGTSEVLFNTSGSKLIFESQYVRLRTYLPKDPNLHGFGEHTDPFRLPTTRYIRTLWNRDAYGAPAGENLYGSFPIYLDHRDNGKTHGVYLLNSNGMDLKIELTADKEQYLEYNTLGGVLDLYFVAGPKPIEVARQFNDVFATRNQMPYWGLGYHQCRNGMRDVYEVAEVVANYSAANIPLETMWTDIDYMDRGKVFSLDPDWYPLEKVQELVRTLHNRGQRYIMRVDPAVAYQDYPPFNHGVERNVFLKKGNGSIYKGVAWPGVVAFPDWFNIWETEYWFRDEFATFFDAETGVDIDAVSIEMNEASNFCPYPCEDPEGYAQAGHFPPMPPNVRQNAPRPIPGFPPDFQPPSVQTNLPTDISSNGDVADLAKHGSIHPPSLSDESIQSLHLLKRQASNGDKTGLPNRNLISPPYQISNAAGSLSDRTLDTSLMHQGVPQGRYTEYDTHNLYGFLMGWTAGGALQHRRPTERQMVIARSTFPTSFAGLQLGDNTATWDAYRVSIAQQLAFVSIFHIPMVGADVCGYALKTTENLCARWAMLGAFSSFYRNHAARGKTPQEFYRWPTVAQAARNAIDIRYRLLDYLYTAMIRQRRDGTPWLYPLWFFYPKDTKTFGIDLQFFFGPGLLVSPVTEEGATSVSIYLPDDVFYDWYTYRPIRGRGESVTLDHISFTSIPLHIKGGSIIPLRVESANTTTMLRTKNFRILIVPGLDGTAKGRLYLDDGISTVVVDATTEINFTFDGRAISMTVLKSDYDAGVKIVEFVILGQRPRPARYTVDGVPVGTNEHSFNQTSGALTIATNPTLLRNLKVTIK